MNSLEENGRLDAKLVTTGRKFRESTGPYTEIFIWRVDEARESVTFIVHSPYKLVGSYWRGLTIEEFRREFAGWCTINR
jgi:hypothetical protein